MERDSKIPGFYKLSIDERIKNLKEFSNLSEEDVKLLKSLGSLEALAEVIGENIVSAHELPLKIATNFKINGKDYLIPMAIEEPSVVAAASNAARFMRYGEGIVASYTGSYMISQIQLCKVNNIEKAKDVILKNKEFLLNIANKKDPVLIKFGGGAKDLEVRDIETKKGKMIIIHLIVDTKDAMGANVVNTMAEAIAPYIEEITGGKVYLRIVSNLATKRLVRAKVKIPKKDLAKGNISGEEVAEGIVYAYAFAEADHYRAVTHNKGIMNGVDAVAIATGNDWRAIEAGAHAYACNDGGYKPLSKWYEDGDFLIGELELPLAVGTVGGITSVYPKARLALKILGVKTAEELACVMAAVGLANNFAALYALSTEGIQRGHMKLHAKNIAIQAGVPQHLIDTVALKMIEEGEISQKRAEELAIRFKSAR